LIAGVIHQLTIGKATSAVENLTIAQFNQRCKRLHNICK